MSFPHRCSKTGCRTRKALKRPIDQYIRRPLCPSCGQDSLKLDKAKQRENHSAKCKCDGYWFPHRKGSLWCRHSTIVPTEEDYQTRYAGTV